MSLCKTFKALWAHSEHFLFLFYILLTCFVLVATKSWLAEIQPFLQQCVILKTARRLQCEWNSQHWRELDKCNLFRERIESIWFFFFIQLAMSWGLGGFKNIVKINSLSVPVLKEIWKRGREVTFTKCLLCSRLYTSVYWYQYLYLFTTMLWGKCDFPCLTKEESKDQRS